MDSHDKKDGKLRDNPVCYSKAESTQRHSGKYSRVCVGHSCWGQVDGASGSKLQLVGRVASIEAFRQRRQNLYLQRHHQDSTRPHIFYRERRRRLKGAIWCFEVCSANSLANWVRSRHGFFVWDSNDLLHCLRLTVDNAGAPSEL